MRFVTPGVGAVRGNSVVVQPTQTTAYELRAHNQYGVAKATLTVTVT